MTIILIGAIIAVIGGIVTALGTYLQNKKSSEKSDRIEKGINKNIDIGESTSAEVKNLKEKNIELKDKADELLIKQAELKEHLQPFIEYAQKIYPNTNIDEGLLRLQQDIKRQNSKIQEIVEPVKLLVQKHQFSKESDEKYKLVITLKTTKLLQLKELEFTVTCEDPSGLVKILDITTEPELSNYHIIGPYLNKISTNGVQAKLKYTPAGIVEFPNVVIYLNNMARVTIEGNYDLKKTKIKAN